MKLLKITLLICAILLAAAQASATDICGTISSTLTITEDSQLTCNVKCTVIGAPCIRFGADSISMNLNGFTITGNGLLDSCTNTASEIGITTRESSGTSHSFVSILGPGLVTQFNGRGIVVSGGSNDTVKGVAVSLTCEDGIFVSGSNCEVRNNTVSGAVLSGSFLYSAIRISGPGNVVKNNEAAAAAGLGIGIFVNSNNNSFVENASFGNSLGIYVYSVSATLGNAFDSNQSLGNRPYGDIGDDNTAGSNTYPIISAKFPEGLTHQRVRISRRTL